MVAVFEIIRILEGTPITTEQLEVSILPGTVYMTGVEGLGRRVVGQVTTFPLLLSWYTHVGGVLAVFGGSANLNFR